jgi:hypothetical protein
MRKIKFKKARTTKKAKHKKEKTDEGDSKSVFLSIKYEG